jgi:hypothetical protein
MGTVDKFERGKYYIVLRDYDGTPDSRWRLKSMCYRLAVGQRLRFRDKGFAGATFLTDDGRLVILEPKIAFRIVGQNR